MTIKFAKNMIYSKTFIFKNFFKQSNNIINSKRFIPKKKNSMRCFSWV